MQCSQFAFVCMYVYIYICHTLIAWAWFLWSRPQTTSQVVLVQPRGDRHVKKIVQELAEMEQEQSKQAKTETKGYASEESKAKEKESDRLRKK